MSNKKTSLISEQDAGSALEKFKTGMTQLATAVKGGGGSSPTTSSTAPQTAGKTETPKPSAPGTAPPQPGAKQPVGNQTKPGAPSKEVGTEDLDKKSKELGVDPAKAAQLLQYYGIKVVKQ